METKEHILLSEMRVYQSNPFINDNTLTHIEQHKETKRKYISGNKGVQASIVNIEGEIVGESAFVQAEQVDSEQFTKIYVENFAAFWELKSPAIRMFHYIISNLLPNKDYVFIDIQDAMKFTQYSTKRSIFQGLTQLLEKNIIARSTNTYKYYINPLMFFNGNRVTFAKTYLRVDVKQNELDNFKKNNALEQ